MIWWKGRGILVPIIFFTVMLGSEAVTELWTGGQRAMDNPLIVSAQFLITAALIFKISPANTGGKEMESVHQPKEVAFGPDTSDPEHSFLSISMQVWSLLIACFGILIVIVSFLEN